MALTSIKFCIALRSEKAPQR
ncbi:hypothetical protein CP8484711_0630, partial [Chlamydia psittaci 84-8471/1]